jgi:1-phosphofructokinase
MNGIVTLTPSAAIDHTYLLSELVLGEVNRAHAMHSELSGKGVNVGHAIALAGHPVTAVLALGEDDLARAGHSTSGLRLRAVGVPGRTRINTTILDGHGQTTKVNESPHPLTDDHWRELCRATLDEIERLEADWLVLCGSVPTRAGSGELVSFTELLRDAAALGARVALDTSGEALDRAIHDFGAVTLIKPNTHELAALVRRELRTFADVIDAASELRRHGVDSVFVSMGEDGALVVAEEGTWFARADADVVANSAGAGDASLAGFLVGESVHRATGDASESALAGALARAASWGALAVGQPTTLLASLDGALQATVVRDPDPATRLRDPARSPGSS